MAERVKKIIIGKKIRESSPNRRKNIKQKK